MNDHSAQWLVDLGETSSDLNVDGLVRVTEYDRDGRPPEEVVMMEKAGVDHALTHSFVGSPETIRKRLVPFLERTGADELIVTGQMFEHTARLRSFEIVSQIRDSLTIPRTGA